jgi:hypothetical protein
MNNDSAPRSLAEAREGFRTSTLVRAQMLEPDIDRGSVVQWTRWEKVEEVLLRHHHKPDIEAARCLYSAFAAHGLGGSPVWAMLVAPPGCMKTELLSSLEKLPRVFVVDKLTPNTFISGQLNNPTRPTKTSASLLHRVGEDGILIYPDFSTMLSMHREHRAAVLADMRRIFDGHLRREFGTAENLTQREWRGRITFLVAATPDVDRHYSIFQSLGERFVMIRWHRPEASQQAAIIAMNQDGPAVKKELADAVKQLFTHLATDAPSVTDALQLKIAALAEFVVRARTHVPRESYGKAIICVPEPEAPTRLAQQLAQLGKGSARLSGRTEVTDADFAIVRRCALDCIPAIRRLVVDAAISGTTSGLKNIPPSTLAYAREELKVLGLFTHGGFELSVNAQDLLTQAGISSVHKVSPPPEGEAFEQTQ